MEGRRCLLCDAEALHHIELKDHYIHLCDDHFRDLWIQAMLESLQPANPKAEKLTKDAIVRVVNLAAKQLSQSKGQVSTCIKCGASFPNQRKLMVHMIERHLERKA